MILTVFYTTSLEESHHYVQKGVRIFLESNGWGIWLESVIALSYLKFRTILGSPKVGHKPFNLMM